MTLTIRKCNYSSHPWRIGVVDAAGAFRQLSHFAFPRKRDAAPFLARLEALNAPWDVSPFAWPETLRRAAAAILEDTPSWREDQALAARGVVAPGRMR